MVASELKGRFKELAQSKYSKVCLLLLLYARNYTHIMQFLVLKLMRYCPKHRSSILSELHGHVLRLLLHREAGQVISDSFELYTNAAEKALLLREFYGKEVVLFVPQQEGTKTGLRTILESLDVDRQKRILTATKENIQLMCVLPNLLPVSCI
jgi:pumilio homology domain family member 6